MTGFQKATKEKSFLRSALFGPSGGGKTYTSLLIATAIAEKLGTRVGVIDSEHGSASKYADRFDFDTCNLEKKDVEAYTDIINMAAKEGFNPLVIDSGSHAWKELLKEIDHIAKTRFGGNKWAAWSEGNPKQDAFIEAILNYPGHLIMTMRSRTEWTMEETQNGKKKPVRVGMAPDQGKGIEYEFDILLEMSTEHACTCIKDRSGKFQDRIIDKPGKEFGLEMLAWLEDGADQKMTINQRKMIMSRFAAQDTVDPEIIKLTFSDILGREIKTSADISYSEAIEIIKESDDTDVFMSHMAKALPPLMTSAQAKKIFALYGSQGISETEDMHPSLSLILKREVETTKTITKTEAKTVIDYISKTDDLIKIINEAKKTNADQDEDLTF